jgi:hypothetical protein
VGGGVWSSMGRAITTPSFFACLASNGKDVIINIIIIIIIIITVNVPIMYDYFSLAYNILRYTVMSTVHVQLFNSQSYLKKISQYCVII